VLDGILHDPDDIDDAPEDFDAAPEATPGRRRVHLPLYVEFVRPMTVGDCRDGPRPCPLVSCEFHLATQLASKLPEDVSDEEVERLLRAMPYTCAQDVIDAHPEGAELRLIGAAFGISHERVRQLERRTLNRYLRGRAERANLREHVDLDEEHLAPWERERQTGRGGPARFAEEHAPHAPPDALVHLPRVTDVADAGATFWCGWLRAAMPVTRCVGRQLHHEPNSRGARHRYHECANCDEGRRLTERVRVRSDLDTNATTAPRPAHEPRTTMTDTTATTTTNTTGALNATPATAASGKLCRCGARPPATVTKITRKGEEELCASCRRIEGMKVNGTSCGGYRPKKTPAAAAPAAKPTVPAKPAPVEKPTKRGRGRPRKVLATPQTKPVVVEPTRANAQTLPQDPITRIAWASRALACAVKVGGIERLEAFVTASVEHGLFA